MKRILSVVLVAVLVLGFSVFALGAGDSTEQTYIGTWEGEKSYNYKIVVLPCHAGQCVLNGIEYSFTWVVDNGYLVIHTYPDPSASIMCFYTNDGKTMKYQDKINWNSMEFTKKN